jgi:hypothetical protein
MILHGYFYNSFINKYEPVTQNIDNKKINHQIMYKIWNSSPLLLSHISTITIKHKNDRTRFLVCFIILIKSHRNLTDQNHSLFY